MTVRELIYGLLAADSGLNALGINANTLFANGAPDSPPEAPGKVWAVLNWGVENTSLGGAARGRAKSTERDCALWVYTRQDDYGGVNMIVKRWCEVMDALEAIRTGVGANDGWVSSCIWQGDSADGWDDVYRANFRNSTYTIIANGD